MEERENKKLGTILNYAIIVCIAAILIMIICGIVGKFLDKKTNRIGEFSERHPRLNMVIALALVVIMGTAGYVSIYYIVCKVKEIIHWIADMASKMDAVVIVALITGKDVLELFKPLGDLKVVEKKDATYVQIFDVDKSGEYRKTCELILTYGTTVIKVLPEERIDATNLVNRIKCPVLKRKMQRQ